MWNQKQLNDFLATIKKRNNKDSHQKIWREVSEEEINEFLKNAKKHKR